MAEYSTRCKRAYSAPPPVSTSNKRIRLTDEQNASVKVTEIALQARVASPGPDTPTPTPTPTPAPMPRKRCSSAPPTGEPTRKRSCFNPVVVASTAEHSAAAVADERPVAAPAAEQPVVASSSEQPTAASAAKQPAAASKSKDNEDKGDDDKDDEGKDDDDKDDESSCHEDDGASPRPAAGLSSPILPASSSTDGASDPSGSLSPPPASSPVVKILVSSSSTSPSAASSGTLPYSPVSAPDSPGSPFILSPGSPAAPSPERGFMGAPRYPVRYGDFIVIVDDDDVEVGEAADLDLFPDLWD